MKATRNRKRYSKASPKRPTGDFANATTMTNSGAATARKSARLARASSIQMVLGKAAQHYKLYPPEKKLRPDVNERDYAIQRYSELYDFAPTGYVSFNRSGRVEEINLTASKLLGMTRESLLGMPFSIFVVREDTPLFLHHLLRCRSSDSHVETELRLKNLRHESFEVELYSVPVEASLRDGEYLYQTSIIDLSERKRAERAIRESEAKLVRDLEDAKKLQRVSSQLIRQDNLELIYQQIVHAAVALLGADAGSLQALEAPSNELRLLASKGLDQATANLWKCLPISADAICAEALRRHERVVVSDIGKCKFLKDKKHLTLFRKLGIRAAQSTPLISRTGQVVGMMSNHWQTEHRPSERELGLIDILTRQASDLIERTQTNDTVRISEERYRTLFELVPVAVYTCDADGYIREYNQRAAELWARLPDCNGEGPRFCGSYKIYYPDGRPMRHEACPMARVLRGEKPASKDLEIVIERPNGERRHVIPAPKALTDEKGKITGGINCLFDVTERRRAEEARSHVLRQQAALYKLAQHQRGAKTLPEIYQAALNTIMTALQCDRASILLYDQRKIMRFVAWHGLSKKYRKAVEGHSPWKHDTKSPQPITIPDINLADISKSLKGAIRSEGIRAAAFIPLIGDRKLIGKFMTYYSAPHSFTDEELKLAATIAQQLVQTIEHRRGEEALRESEERLRAIVNQANAGMVRYDLKGRIQFVNRRFCTMLGYKESELLGKSVHEITHPDDLAETIQAFKNVESKGKTSELDKRYVRKNGSIVWVNVCDAPELDNNGRSKFVVAVAVDITARRKAEEALRQSNEILEELVEQRTRALSVTNAELSDEIERRKGLEGEILSVSDREQQRLGQELHDGLCQHLTAVAFMTRSVALRLKNHRVIEVSDIEKIAQLVNDAATDTRNLSRALHRLDVDAAGLVTALQDLVDREIWRTPCRLEVKTSFRIEDDTAAAHLYRIAREAVINANKHAQAREIVVKLGRSWREMALHVIDDGIGISDYPKFNQGLGLHIMKYRSQLIGGRIEIDSHRGAGTRVSCYVPDAAPESRKSRKKRNGEVRRSSPTSQAQMLIV